MKMSYYFEQKCSKTLFCTPLKSLSIKYSDIDLILLIEFQVFLFWFLDLPRYNNAKLCLVILTCVAEVRGQGSKI